MIGIRRCLGLVGFAGALAIGASSAMAQQSFSTPAPDGYPPNWNRPTQAAPATAAFVPGSDAYHWISGSAPSSTASASGLIYQMQPGSNHYHRIQ